MDENTDIKFTNNHYFFIAAVFIILSACAIALSIMDFETATPAVSKVRITRKDNKIILSYKKSGYEKNNKVTIEWLFNGKPEKEYQDLRLIPVPFAADTTVEIECRVSVYDTAGKSLPVKSNKILYIQKSEKNIPAVPISDISSPAASETLHESSEAALKADSRGAVSADIAKSINDRTSSGHQNISEPEDDTASVNIQPESGSGPSAEKSYQTCDYGKTSDMPETGETDFQAASDAVEFNPPAPIFSQNDQQPMFKDNSTKKEPSLGVVSTSKKSTDHFIRSEVHKPHSVRASEYYHKPHRPATIENYINNASGGHETLLHFAARCDDVRLAFDAFAKGADIDARDINDSTPLHTAILNNSLETSKFLIANGANIKARDKKGRTPLHIAAVKKSKKSAMLLLNKENLSNNKEANSAPGSINRLVNITDNRAQTPLHTAASHDADEIASILIENGADINARDITKSTPLHYAVLNKSRAVIAILIYKNADIAAKDEFGQTPDYFADEDIKRILLPRATDENQLKPDAKAK